MEERGSIKCCLEEGGGAGAMAPLLMSIVLIGLQARAVGRNDDDADENEEKEG